MKRLSAILLFSCLTVVFAANSAEAWQQRVEYRMNVVVDVDDHSYEGQQQLLYANNSPDTLTEVYYHLFYNAFQPGSAMDRRDRSLPGGGWKRIYALPDSERGEVRVGSLQQNGQSCQYSIDGTVLRVKLPTPVLPQDSTVLELAWTTSIPRLKRRGGWMNREGVEFSMSQWYPKLAEYDEHGWHNDQYVGREFYGVFGSFHVSITLPADYVVGATGMLQNPEEVGCGYELSSHDTIITNPARRERHDESKTWIWFAEDVHDFAWAADREYAHIINQWDSKPIHVLVKRATLHGLRHWSLAGRWTAEILTYYSSRFGYYDWPQFTVVQAGDGGMEYPMLTMVTGRRSPSSLFGVLAHEIGHQWYYGMMANNETQQAWLDEGLTSYLDDEASRDLRGNGTGNPLSGLERIVYPWDNARWRDIESYYRMARSGTEEALDTYHDRFRSRQTARLVYSKGEAVVRQLEYMLGDSLFEHAMKQYYHDWKFRHPDQRDFERSIERATGMRLDWFFNQWINSTKTCDYAMTGLESYENSTGGYTTVVELANEDEIVMPIDLHLTYADGTKATATIPVQSWKKPGVDYHLAPWFWVDRTYRDTFETRKRVVRAVIDSSMTLLDLDRIDNQISTGFASGIVPPTTVSTYKRWDLNPPVDSYWLSWRPVLWYSEYDGVQLGAAATGAYMRDRHAIDIGAGYNLRSGRVDYRAEYEADVPALGTGFRTTLRAANSDGVEIIGASIQKRFSGNEFHSSSTPVAELWTENERLLPGNYPNEVVPWDSGSIFRTGFLLSSGVSARGLSANIGGWISGMSGSDAAQFTVDASYRRVLGQFRVSAILFGGTSTGSIKRQHLFNAAGSSGRSNHDNVVHRLASNVSPPRLADAHLVLPGAGRLLSRTTESGISPYGRHLLNAEVAVELPGPAAFRDVWGLAGLGFDLYAAGGYLFEDHVTVEGFEDPVLETGATVRLDLLRLIPRVVRDALNSPDPVVLRLRIPLVATGPGTGRRNVDWRWSFSVSH